MMKRILRFNDGGEGPSRVRVKEVMPKKMAALNIATNDLSMGELMRYTFDGRIPEERMVRNNNCVRLHQFKTAKVKNANNNNKLFSRKTNIVEIQRKDRQQQNLTVRSLMSKTKKRLVFKISTQVFK